MKTAIRACNSKSKFIATEPWPRHWGHVDFVSYEQRYIEEENLQKVLSSLTQRVIYVLEEKCHLKSLFFPYLKSQVVS